MHFLFFNYKGLTQLQSTASKVSTTIRFINYEQRKSSAKLMVYPSLNITCTTVKPLLQLNVIPLKIKYN